MVKTPPRSENGVRWSTLLSLGIGEPIPLSDISHEMYSLAIVEDDSLLRPELPPGVHELVVDDLCLVSSERTHIGEKGLPHYSLSPDFQKPSSE